MWRNVSRTLWHCCGHSVYSVPLNGANERLLVLNCAHWEPRSTFSTNRYQIASTSLISKTRMLNIFRGCHLPVADQGTDISETLSNTAPIPMQVSEVPKGVPTVVGMLPADMAEELHHLNSLVQSLLDLPTSCSQVGGAKLVFSWFSGQCDKCL